MKRELTAISPLSTAKALVLVYLTLALPITAIAGLVLSILHQQVDFGVVISAVLLNAIFGFVVVWLICHAYNWVAGRFGGIEFETSGQHEEA